MSTEQNKLVVRRMFEEPWNQGNVAALDDICDPSYRINDRDGTAWLKAWIPEFRHGFPDAHMTIEEMVAEGDTVVARWTLSGTHLGEFEGVAPTGKPLKNTGISIYHLANGKIVDDRFESSGPPLRDQLLGS